jgi:uncharacterized membrane protein YdfJ with MMPL/SSD domain
MSALTRSTFTAPANADRNSSVRAACRRALNTVTLASATVTVASSAKIK